MSIGLIQPIFSSLPIHINRVEAVEAVFADATHDVYHLYATEGEFALKVLRANTSPFWQGMQELFGINLSKSIIGSPAHYRCASEYFMFQIPSLMAYTSVDEALPAYTLTSWLQGDAIDTRHISNSLIESLAKADAKRHSVTCTTWGGISEPFYPAQQWAERIHRLLPQADEQSLSELALVDTFVPMVMDMRWDQCLQQQGRISALVDVDALVFAPKALELVMLEYWLDEAQLALWTRTYQACGGVIPILSGVRGLYRQLLWPWQLWGEVSLLQWMSRKTFFA